MFVLLHQGGWDEFLYFSVPVVLGFIGLRYAEKQARAKAETRASEAGGESGETSLPTGEDA
ncbi:MAG: hypothetical protein JSV07_05350 [Acidimicrobiia bacterium]|nr:MAG: hypothetical protein JSV07_05350 [Acidimicrobiia bacterium]